MFMLRSTHKRVVKQLEDRIERLETELNEYVDTSANLASQLAQSRKNDSKKDPKTGKFVNKSGTNKPKKK